MTKTIRLVSDVLVVSLLAVGLYGCTVGEMRDRQKSSEPTEQELYVLVTPVTGMKCKKAQIDSSGFSSQSATTMSTTTV